MNSSPSRIRETIDGTEKFCGGCNEWWPADREFFWAQRRGTLGLHSLCKACYTERDRRKGRDGAVRFAALQGGSL